MNATATPASQAPATRLAALSFATLPQLNTELDGGIFAGVHTRPDGVHCAVVLLPEAATKLPWKKAVAWAKDQGGELPSRPVAALLFANVKARLTPTWHWTSEEDDASYAWFCYFGTGSQSTFHKSYEGGAVAVRMIPITP